MFESGAEALHLAIEFFFPGVCERRVPYVVRERQRFREFVVQPQHRRHRPRDLRNFQRMSQPVAEMIAKVGCEDLCFTLEPAEASRVDDAVSVPLVIVPVRVGKFGIFPAAG